MNSVTSAPLVSVVMAVFNGTAYLRQAIESALGQTYSNLELVVMDDCSTDYSVALVESYLTDSRVKLIRSTRNSGVAAARNRALGLARGDLIAFLDQDDIWIPRKLELQVAALRAHPGQQSNRGHRMLMIRIEALDRILPRFPEAKWRVPEDVFRRRMHSMCHSAANYTMYHLHDYHTARELFARTVSYRPLDVSSWGKYAYCALPARVRETLKKIAAKCKSPPPTST